VWHIPVVVELGFVIAVAFPFTLFQSALLGLWLAFGWLVFA